LARHPEEPFSCNVVGTNDAGTGEMPNAFRRAKLPYNHCPSDDSVKNIPPGANPADPRGSYYSSLGPTYIFPDKPCPAPSAPPSLPFASYYTNPAPPAAQLPYFATAPNFFNGYSGSLRELPGMFNPSGHRLSVFDVLDGLSNTIAIGEVIPGEADFRIGKDKSEWYYAFYALSTTAVPINYRTDNTTCIVGQELRSSRDQNIALGFKSRHPGGSNFLLGDGSARYIAQGLSMNVYQLLGARNDNTPVQTGF
jgi:prepilin-type processing-associated H-X9-DG protein